jgi:sterol desaturase/sphingolipid hydroxylase (fatty acid hydroxylase superfamily)
MLSYILYDGIFMCLYIFVSYMICVREGYQFRKPLRNEISRGIESFAIQLPLSNIAMELFAPFGSGCDLLVCMRYLVLFDTIVFWMHWAFHAFPYLYETIHREHHQTIWVSPFSATILNWKEHILVGVVPTLLPLYFLDMSMGAWSIMNSLIFMYGMVIHSSMNFPGAHEHASHHVFKNTHFGFILPLWDMWMGTATYPISRENLLMGVANTY